MEGHIFISHSPEDQAYARKLVADLQRHGFEAWIDAHIDFGDVWWRTIVKAIRSCAALIVVMTPDSEQSEWVEREIMLALDEGKPIFPLLLRGENFPIFVHQQYTDVSSGKMPPPELYDRMADAVGLAKPVVTQVSAVLLQTVLSGDRTRINEAVTQLAASEPDSEGGLHRRWREQLLQVMRDPSRPAKERVSAGDALSLVGDPRFRADAWYLPNEPLLGFVEIPAGPFTMGTREEDFATLAEHIGWDERLFQDEVPQHEVRLPRYFIARYPVTVAQFRAFMEQSGRLREDTNRFVGFGNHPVARVLWEEAMAYCQWLTERLRAWEETPEPLATWLKQDAWEVMLPSEAQWEKAARGEDGRTFPWGEKPDPNRANYNDTRIGATSTVGCFPGGGSPYHVEEMSGNAWEWTRSLWSCGDDWPAFGYPYDPTDGREDLKGGLEVAHVVRGGSFFNSRWLARCAVRARSGPSFDWYAFGFRVVVSPISPDSGL